MAKRGSKYPDLNMKLLKPICVILLFLAATLPCARADILRTNINPALSYYRAFLAQPEGVADTDRDYLFSKKAKEEKLPARFGKVVGTYDRQFQMVRQAAQSAAPCDWGIDLGPGPNVLLPQLARLRALSQVGQLRAVWYLQQGRQDEAREELLASFIMGRNAAADGLLISAFVQCSVECISYGTVAQYFSEFTPETLQRLVAGYDAAPARRTVASCMASEKSLGDWTLHKVQELQKTYPNDDAKALAGLRDAGLLEAMDFIGYTNFWPRLLAASGGTSEGVLRLLRETEPLFPRFGEILALPEKEFVPAVREFLAGIRESQNPFFAEFAFILEKWQTVGFRAREFKAEAQLQMVRAATEYKLHGESGLSRVRDPFGNGPFSYRRFMFKGVDRGFELKSAYVGADAPFVLIFVEKMGPAFQISGAEAGKAITQ